MDCHDQVICSAAANGKVVDAEMDPSVLVNQAIEPVLSELRQLNEVIRSLAGAQTNTARDVIEHIFEGGGKRIRPALFFMSADLVGYHGQHRMPMAVVCEFVHTASLLHDDVIDSSSLRRNKPTSNSIWGDESSVLTGDLIYARASELMAETGSLQIVSMFAKAIRLMSEGELLQLEHLYDPEMPLENYFRIIENKTSALLSAACSAPGILKGCSPEQCRLLFEFGRNVGFAFQLLDDALDYSGSEPVFGKKTLADLPEGKVTLPVLRLREVLEIQDWSIVSKIIRKSEISKKDMSIVLEYVNEFDTAGHTLELAERYTLKAIESLSAFEEGEMKSRLINLTKSLLVRLS